jgi:NADH:ubiquinone oxidoreductase subunit 2 (subunit N)
LVSLAGIPPLSGFSAKFLAVMFLFLSDNYLLLFYFFFLNFFFIYFYVQNLRGIVSNPSSDSTLFFKKSGKSVYFQPLVNIIVFLTFFNLFGIFFLEDFVLYFNYVFSFIFTY